MHSGLLTLLNRSNKLTRLTAERCLCSSGVSAEALSLADATAYIPMSGFVSSFNVSVAAALVFYEARRARLERLGYHCDLTDHDKQVLTAVMLLRHQVDSFSFFCFSSSFLLLPCRLLLPCLLLLLCFPLPDGIGCMTFPDKPVDIV